jgi:hypothetical protein
MAEWIWVLLCAASLVVTIPAVLRVRGRDIRRRVLTRTALLIGYLLLALLLLADAFVPTWTNATLRFTRGCVAGLGVGAIIGALALIVRWPQSHR